MRFKANIAILLTGIYLIGLSMQFVPVLAKTTFLDGQVKKMCPRKDANHATDYAFNQASNAPSQEMAQSIFIPCLSSQDKVSAYEGLNLGFNSLRLLIPIKANYESPDLAMDPFPPKLA